ncbi:MAG: hypothetical protein HOP12_15600 [Candidatus Eisenbacteria bacterium]|uniref:Uncharacterized protein n=1 Tax=Eiseniibacteriota bacterium TaxID=2212470 RepID=A0A849T2Q5_UNCEI|nr:hypothetical protein [Candidatus Eisenbacteria bacterium]
MTEARRRRINRRVWWAVLGACTLWLVIQNTVLLITLSASRPDVIAESIGVMTRTALRLAPFAWLVPSGLCAVTLVLGAVASLRAGAPLVEVHHE